VSSKHTLYNTNMIIEATWCTELYQCATCITQKAVYEHHEQ